VVVLIEHEGQGDPSSARAAFSDVDRFGAEIHGDDDERTFRRCRIWRRAGGDASSTLPLVVGGAG